jgi:gliding motility-associated-like protein
MCAGSPVSFTAGANIVINTSVTPGTSIAGYYWVAPPIGTAFGGTTTIASTTASSGQHSVAIVHNGAAGSCTAFASANVVIGTSIPVSFTSSSTNGSLCPNQCVTLTAVSIQSAALNYSWTQNAGTPANLGNTGTFGGTSANGSTISLVRCPGPGSFPRTYTVNVDYFGCPGQATLTLGLLALTPTLTASSGLSSCPGQSITLTASGGVTYTFNATPTSGTPTNAIPKGAATTPTAIHVPSFANLPIQYCVNTASVGCVGSACIIVSQRTLQPILTASSLSVCPGTEFTLRSTVNGTNTTGGSSYTFVSAFTPTLIGSGTNSFVLYTPPSPGGLNFPQTYSVVTDSAGCTGTGTVEINQLTLKTVLSSTSPSICVGTSVTLNASGGAGTNYTFTSSHPQFTSSATSTLINAGPTPTVWHTPPLSNSLTSASYTVFTDSAGCTGSATHSIGILDLGPTINFGPQASAQRSICPGTSISFTANGALSYTFTSPAPSSTVFGTPSATTKSAVVTATDVTTPLAFAPFKIYTVRGDSGGCVGTKTIAIFERVLQPTIALTPTLVCSGQQVTLTAGGIDVNNLASPPISYTFVATPPIPSATISTGSATLATHNPTTLTIYVAQVDSANCKGITPTVTVNIRPDLALVVSASTPSVCAGLVSTLSVAGPTAATSIQYTWTQTVGSGSIFPTNPATTDTIRVHPITNSTYSVFALDSLGCVGNTVINVGIDPNLTFSISMSNSSPTICTPFNSTLTASSNATAFTIGSINYTWSPLAGISPATGSLVVAQPSATTIYTVKGDNGFGCKAENTVSVYVGIIPQPTYAATSNAVCPGFTSTLTAFGANSYTWISSTSSIAIAQQSVSVGPGNFTIIASNGGSCTNTLSPIPIGLLTPSLALPINIISSSPTTCISSNFPKFSKPVNLKASGAATYVWFPYNPNNMTYSLGASTDVRPPSTTQYTVIGSSAVCSNTQVVTVNVIPQFSMNVTPPLPAICLGDSLKLSITNIGTLAVGPASAFTYSWTEALNAPPISLTSYFTPTVAVFPQNTTTYSVEVRDSRACISLPRLVTVTVLPRPLTAIAIPTINSVATNTVCFVGLNPGAQDVTINLTGVNLNPALQFGVVPTYTWISPYPNTYSSILTPANNNAITVSAPIRELNNNAVVVYTLISGYNGVPGCFRQDTVSVRVIDCRPIRDVKFTTAQLVDTICVRSCITYVNLTDTMAGIPQKLKWSFQGGSPATSTANIPTVCYNFPGKYDVILQVSNPYPLINPTGGPPGSTLTIGKLSYIKVVDVPNVTIVSPGQLRSDTTIRFGQSVDLNGSGAIRFSWSPPYNISSLSNPSVQVAPQRTTQYILTGYNSKACFSSDTIDVRVIDNSCGEMYVPNAFTPNNDGVNDVLYVRGICLESLTFMIFNRWGEKVFETADQKNGWDGSYKGEDLNTGVFVYRLEGKTFEGKAFESKGNITLLR